MPEEKKGESLGRKLGFGFGVISGLIFGNFVIVPKIYGANLIEILTRLARELTQLSH